MPATAPRGLPSVAALNRKSPLLVDALRMDVRIARAHRLYARLRPRPSRILVTKPRVSLGDIVTEGGLHTPEHAHRWEREFGVFACVLRIGPDCDPELREGDMILLPYLAGTPVFDIVTNRLVCMWLVGDGDIMCTIDPAHTPTEP